MSNIVKIKYDARTLAISININEVPLDTSKITGKPIEEFAYPFKKNSVIWYGLFKEIANVTKSEDFEIEFDGDPASLEILKSALPNVKIASGTSANLVVVIYNQVQLTTKIVVNGKPLDVTKVQNRALEEIIVPITVAAIGWKGIFTEIADAVGTEEYTIQFLGDASSMVALIEACPDTVNIIHKATPPRKAPSGTMSSSNNVKPAIAQNAGPATEQNFDNIPIKNKFIRDNIQAICAGMTLLFFLLPFAKLISTVETEYASSQAVAKVSGITSIFSSRGTILGLFLLLIPILIITLNYIKPLNPYRRQISIFCPLSGVVLEIITFIVLKNKLKSSIQVTGASEEEVSTAFKYNPQIGFFLILIMFIVTGIVGYISYYGLTVPGKKKK